jgi:hypothetical protein
LVLGKGVNRAIQQGEYFHIYWNSTLTSKEGRVKLSEVKISYFGKVSLLQVWTNTS